MGTRTLLKRIERAEQAAKTQSKFSPDCTCFPPNEPPFFGMPFEEEVSFGVKCALHGDRFKRQPSLYVSKWRREKEPARRLTLSAQYRKAWDASFPPLGDSARKETDTNADPNPNKAN